MTTEPAEHARFHDYVQALSQVADADESGLLTVVLSDPDRAMAESAVIGHLDRRAAALPDGWSFTDWSRQIAPILDGHDVPERRLREWSLLKEIDSGRPWKIADLIEASDWLQRRIADGSASQEALSVLADNGRTSRIRNSARSRIRQPS